MSNDIVRSPASRISSVIEKLNLPSMIAGPAGAAISRLIGAGVDIPVAYLESLARGIRAKTEERDAVNEEIATAAARLAGGDNDIVGRAAHVLIAKEYRRQNNKVEIAVKTIELLRDETGEQAQHVGSASRDEHLADVDADWLNVFEKYAEDATFERLQETWARVLAGEIRKPRSFSLKTLRFVSELDSYTAEMFEKYAAFVFSEDFIPSALMQSGQWVAELYHLQDFGLLSGVGGNLTKNFVANPDDVPFALNYCGRTVLFKTPANTTLQIKSVLLTTTAREILRILHRPFDLDKLKLALAQLPKERFRSIELVKHPKVLPKGPANISVETLWQQPS
jgi:Protein of unknown function (DUF2806)